MFQVSSHGINLFSKELWLFLVEKSKLESKFVVQYTLLLREEKSGPWVLSVDRMKAGGLCIQINRFLIYG